MKKGVVLAIILVVGVAAIAVAQNLNTIKGSWRYKVTVEVQTPEGLKTGSAVREVDVYYKYNSVGARSVTKMVKGEAVAVDLGKRGVLFALMGTDDYYTVFQKFPPPDTDGDWGKIADYYHGLVGKTAMQEPEQYPKLVRFKNSEDPKTVQLVLETGGCQRMNAFGHCVDGKFKIMADHFEEFFGKGVRLKDIKVEITDEPVTRKIEEYLPSFGEETGFWAWFKTLRYGDPRRIGPNNFK